MLAVSTDDDKPEEPSEFDRMSLNSLRRELDVQKAKTKEAREDAHERIREGAEGKTPWAKIIIGCTVGLVVIGGAVFVLRSALPPMEDWSLPEFEETPFDAGSLSDFAPDSGTDAGFDAGPAQQHHGRRHHGHHGHDEGPTKAPGGLDFGDSEDPIGGLTSED